MAAEPVPRSKLRRRPVSGGLLIAAGAVFFLSFVLLFVSAAIQGPNEGANFGVGFAIMAMGYAGIAMAFLAPAFLMDRYRLVAIPLCLAGLVPLAHGTALTLLFLWNDAGSQLSEVLHRYVPLP